MEKDWKSYRDKIIGLGEFSLHKSYYPELQDNIDILEASQKNLQFLIDSISDAIIIHDFAGKILYVNKQALIIFNLSETEYSTFTILDITSPIQDLSRLNSILNDFSNISTQAFEWIGIQQKTNIDLPLQVSLSPTQWYSKPAMVAVIRDFTERKKFEQELIAAKEKAEKSERNIKTIFNTSKNIMLLLDNNYCIVDANNAALKKADCSYDEMINASVFNLLLPNLYQETKHWLDTSWGASKIEDFETITFDRSGNKFIVEISASKIDYDNTEVMLLNMNDISQRKELEQELLKSVINTEEKERLLFSQELHDGLGPIISAIKMYTDWLSGSEGIPPELLPEIFCDIHQLVSEASETIREISFKLSPHILLNYGLVEALEAYIEKIKLSPKIKFITKFDHFERFNETNETIAYRVICECINNCIKHAKASEIVLKIIQSDGNLLINFNDNGIGFNFSEVLKKHKGSGLLNMQSRIKSISGDISFNSDNKQGTSIFIKIPTV